MALCTTYGISDEAWKLATDSLIRHIFLEDLFPSYGSASEKDVVARILRENSLVAKDSRGSIYATVSSRIYFTFIPGTK